MTSDQLRIKTPAEWYKVKQKLADGGDLWKFSETTNKICALEKEWERLYFLAYHARCKSNDRLRRVKLAREYCLAMNGLLEHLLKEIFWTKLSK